MKLAITPALFGSAPSSAPFPAISKGAEDKGGKRSEGDFSLAETQPDYFRFLIGRLSLKHRGRFKVRDQAAVRDVAGPQNLSAYGAVLWVGLRIAHASRISSARAGIARLVCSAERLWCEGRRRPSLVCECFPRGRYLRVTADATAVCARPIHSAAALASATHRATASATAAAVHATTAAHTTTAHATAHAAACASVPVASRLFWSWCARSGTTPIHTTAAAAAATTAATTAAAAAAAAAATLD